MLLHLGPGLANALANLHNARRAGTPLLNIVGDMATWHHGADALLEMDIGEFDQDIFLQTVRSYHQRYLSTTTKYRSAHRP